MNVQLRNGNGYPSRGSMPPPRMSRRRGIGQSNINPTTIWTPQGGFNFNSGGSSGPAVFQAPTVIPPPACSSDTQPGGAAFSAACIAELLAYQQQNMQSLNNANYSVDLQNCLSTYPQPTDCYQRTFGLTPTGGYTSDSGPDSAPVILDANGNPVADTVALLKTPVPTPPPAPIATPTQTPTATPPQTGGTTAASTNAGGGSTSSSTSGAAVVPTPVNPMLYWIAGIAAVALIISAVK